MITLSLVLFSSVTVKSRAEEDLCELFYRGVLLRNRRVGLTGSAATSVCFTNVLLQGVKTMNKRISHSGYLGVPVLHLALPPISVV